MKLQINTLSPMHIGNGEVLKPLSYVRDEKFVYILNMETFFKNLQKEEGYLDWIEPLLYQLSELKDKLDRARDNPELKKEINKQIRNMEERLSIEYFIKNRINKNPLEFVKDCTSYKVPFLSPPQKDGFRTFIKNGNGLIYVPGTEIKGTIRTSLLYSMLQDNNNYKTLKSEVERFRDVFRSGVGSREKIKALKNISREIEGKLLRGRENKAYFDFFKFLKVSDTASIPLDRLKIEATMMIGTNRYTKTWVETIIPFTEFTFEFDIDDKEISLNKLGLKDLKKYLEIERLFEACYHRSKDILEEEFRYFSNKPAIATLIGKLKVENTPMSPLIRFGAGQGFMGVTINLILKKMGEVQLYDEAIREGVSYQRRWRTQKNNFPKTRRVITDVNGEEVSVMGWAKLIKK